MIRSRQTRLSYAATGLANGVIGNGIAYFLR